MKLRTLRVSSSIGLGIRPTREPSGPGRQEDASILLRAAAAGRVHCSAGDLRSVSADEQVGMAIHGFLQRSDQLLMKLVQFTERRGINCGQFIQETLGLSGG